MIIGHLKYDKRGNAILPPISQTPPAPTEHLDITPYVIHRIVWEAHNESSFEKAYDTAIEMLSDVPGFTLVSETPSFSFSNTSQGILKTYTMEMIYFIDPGAVRHKRSLLGRIFGRN